MGRISTVRDIIVRNIKNPELDDRCAELALIIECNFMSVKEYAEATGVTTGYVINSIRQNMIPFIVINSKCFLIPRKYLKRYQLKEKMFNKKSHVMKNIQVTDLEEQCAELSLIIAHHFVSATTAIRMIGCSLATLYDMIASDDVPCIEIGNGVCIIPREFIAKYQEKKALYETKKCVFMKVNKASISETKLANADIKVKAKQIRTPKHKQKTICIPIEWIDDGSDGQARNLSEIAKVFEKICIFSNNPMRTAISSKAIFEKYFSDESSPEFDLSKIKFLEAKPADIVIRNSPNKVLVEKPDLIPFKASKIAELAAKCED